MPCPDENDFLGFLDGHASDAEAEVFEEHLASCSDCQALIAELGKSLEGPAAHWHARSGGDVVGPGSQVGRYLIVEEIGAGAMGVVFRARDPKLDRDVALKLVRVLGLAPEDAERARQRLLKEAVAMAQLAEPNVVAVHDVSIVDDAVFVAMELVEGVNLTTWLDREQPRWQEIVRVFIEAGRGLAAAHDAHILHRDFKPANLLIGPGSRVRVADFGLAVPTATARLAKGSEPERDAPAGHGATRLVAGSPAYMSPEARAGHAIDERSDQYSFAASLCEALTGHLPTDKGLPAIPAPRRVVRVLQRALRTDPADRFSSMHAVALALTRARRFGRRVALAGVAAGAVLIALAAGFYSGHSPEPNPCTAGRTRMASVWNAEKAGAMQAAFAATELAFADSVFATARGNLDRFKDHWLLGYLDACQATHVRKEQSPALLDLRMFCLGDELRRFASSVDLLASATPGIVGRAISISTLGDGLDRCAKVDVLTRETPRPFGDKAAAEIERISVEYDRIRRLSQEGKQKEALAATTTLVDEARAVGYHRMEAEIVGYLGELLWHSGDLDSAITNLYLAVASAELARSDDIRAGTMSVLVAVIGFEQARYDEALQIARLAELALRATNDVGRLANLMSNRGSIYFARGDYELAEAEYEAAHAIMIEEYGPEDSRTGQILNNLALMAEQRSDHAEAVATYSQALTIYEKALGPSHPQIALTLANRASSHANLGSHQKARGDLERALAIRREVLGDGHASVGETYRIMAQFDNEAGELAAALEHGEQARALLQPIVGDRHPDMAATRAVIGETLLRLKRYPQALIELRAALAIWAELDIASPLVAVTRYNLAMAMWEAGESHVEARAMALKAKSELAGNSDVIAEIDSWLAERS